MYEVLFLIAIFGGLAVGTYFIARSPEFWAGLLSHVIKSMLPTLAKRMPPEQEAAWRDCQRRGGKWNNHKRRCE